MIQIIIICTIVGILVNLCATGDLKLLTPAYLIIINAITFLAYAWDRFAASYGWWRIMKFTLHTLDFIGGWPAALIVQYLLNHKTGNFCFQLIFWLMGILCVSAIVFVTHQYTLN
jgi:uncharacterized membrane protein YsdA (DUF1294 family)